MSDILDAIKKTEEAILDELEAIHLIKPKEEREAHKAAEGTESVPKKDHYTIDTENLAMPETHTGKVDHSEKEDEEESGLNIKKPEIRYDTAVPEIHFKKQ